MSKKPQIPLAEVMKAIDKKDRQWYYKLTEEQKKAFSAWMMMRYASTVRGKHDIDYLYLVNECVNRNFSDISKHPELQWLLFTVCGVGQVQNHEYIKPPNARKKKNKIQTAVSEMFPHLKKDELDLFMQINTKDEIKEYFANSGLQDKEIKEIFK